MARIRTIKPEFFRHATLFDLEAQSGLPLRVAFAGLLTACDREGRFEWKPRELKLDCLPYDQVDFELVLEFLMRGKFVAYYESDGRAFGVVPGFVRHQIVNNRESVSRLPAPPDACPTRAPRVTILHVQDTGEGKGREGEGKGKEGEGVEPRVPRVPSKATRWPSDAVVSDEWITLADAARLKHGLPPIDLNLEAERFANYWSARGDRGAAKTDWQKTWINWSLKADGNPKRGGGDFFGDLAGRLGR